MKTLDCIGRTGNFSIYTLPVVVHWGEGIGQKLGKKSDAIAAVAVREIGQLGWPHSVLYHYFEVRLGDYVGRFWLTSSTTDDQLSIEIWATDGPITVAADQVPEWLRELVEED